MSEAGGKGRKPPPFSHRRSATAITAAVIFLPCPKCSWIVLVATTSATLSLSRRYTRTRRRIAQAAIRLVLTLSNLCSGATWERRLRLRSRVSRSGLFVDHMGDPPCHGLAPAGTKEVNSFFSAAGTTQIEQKRDSESQNGACGTTRSMARFGIS